MGARRGFALWGGEAVVVAADRLQLEQADAAVRHTVEAFDLACSSFRADSELALVNASAGEPVVVSSLLMIAVTVALRAAREPAVQWTRQSARR